MDSYVRDSKNPSYPPSSESNPGSRTKGCHQRLVRIGFRVVKPLRVYLFGHEIKNKQNVHNVESIDDCSM